MPKVYNMMDRLLLTFLALLLSSEARAFDELCAQAFCTCAEAARTVDCTCETNKQAKRIATDWLIAASVRCCCAVAVAVLSSMLLL